jgi:hypothetical protein
MEVDDRRGGAVGLGVGRDLRDGADAMAALADLVALDQARPVGQLDLDVIGRDERQPVVGVVGQEHRDDRHEDGDAADEDRVGGDRGVAAAVHLPPSWPRR